MRREIEESTFLNVLYTVYDGYYIFLQMCAYSLISVIFETPSLSMGNLQGRILEWEECHALFQGIFPSHGWNSCLLKCVLIL